MNERLNRPPPPLVPVTGGLPLGGSSTFLLNLAGAMQRLGHTLPVLVLSTRNELAEDFQRLGTPVHCVDQPQWIFEDRLLAGYQFLRDQRPAAVLSCLSSESFEPLRVVPRGVVRLGVVQSHDPGPYQVVRQFGGVLDAVVGVSGEICRHLRSLPELAHARIEHIPYGIEFGPAPQRVFDSTQPLRLIYLGRMAEEQKRVRRLVALAGLLAAQKVNVRFTIAGDGPERAELRQALAGCDLVEFRDAIPYREVPAILAAHDVFVLLSDYEGLPLSLLEAMGAGLVPVVSDLASGLREVVTSDCGVRVPTGDVPAAAAAIAALAGDRERLAALSAKATQRAREEYSAARMAEGYLALINSLAQPGVDWPATVRVPVPYGVKHPWLYDGLPRVARRWVKRFSGGWPGASSRL